MAQVISVAVIGAGAAGLSALKLLAHDPNPNDLTTFKVTAFEKSAHVGGAWFYTDDVGKDEHGLPIHTSMYKSLRANLAKECMGYPDFPFPPQLPSYVKREDVLNYLKDFATHFDLWQHIKFRTIVEHVKPVPDANNKFGVKWEVTTSDVTTNCEDTHTEMFDAVLVCNGHFTKPQIPEIPGLGTFTGELIHSHDYREPNNYVDKTVLVLGAGHSGIDIAIEVASVATKVYLSHNKPPLTTFLPSNVMQIPGIKCCDQNTIELRDGDTIEVDAIILCTGYHYDYHFLDESVGVTVENESVRPLYKHLLPVKYPSLGLVGVVKNIIPLPFSYMQIQYFRSILDGSGTLPSEKERISDEEEEWARLKARDLPERYFHVLFEQQWDHLNQLADLGHFDPPPSFKKKVFELSNLFREADVTTYRDNNFIISGEDNDAEVYVIDSTTNSLLC